MGPIEMEITDQVTGFIAEGSSVILVHLRDPDLMLAAIKKLETAQGHKTLSIHYWDEEHKKQIREVFRNYWHLFSLIIWNKLSRPGYRSDVRFHNWEIALKLFSKWVHFIDSDLDNRAFIWEERDGITKMWAISGDEILTHAHEILAQQIKLGRFCTGFKHDDNHLGRVKWMDGAPILGGFYVVSTEKVREWREEHPNYNPFRESMEADMQQVEDIAAGWSMKEANKISRCGYLSWDGDRKNYRMSKSFIDDHSRCRVITSHRYMQLYSRKLWTHHGGGEFVPINTVAEKITYDKDVINPIEEGSHLIIEAVGISDDFANLYTGVINAD